jgi:hypothetical protein
MHSWCTTSALPQGTMEWIPLCGAHSTVSCGSALVVHHEYFEHFKGKFRKTEI